MFKACFQDAKTDIKIACIRRDPIFGLVIKIIEKKTKNRLHGPLHLAAYYLSLYYFYKDKVAHEDSIVMASLLQRIDAFYPDFTTQDIITNLELQKYKLGDGILLSVFATIGKDSTVLIILIQVILIQVILYPSNFQCCLF